MNRVYSTKQTKRGTQVVQCRLLLQSREDTIAEGPLRKVGVPEQSHRDHRRLLSQCRPPAVPKQALQPVASPGCRRAAPQKTREQHHIITSFRASIGVWLSLVAAWGYRAASDQQTTDPESDRLFFDAGKKIRNQRRRSGEGICRRLLRRLPMGGI